MMANEDTALKEPSKMDRVREAMKELGKDAKPQAIKDWLATKYKLDVEKGMISAYKNKIGKESAAKKAAKVAGQPARSTAAVVSQVQANGHTQGNVAGIILRVRALVAEVGSSEGVKELVDALA